MQVLFLTLSIAIGQTPNLEVSQVGADLVPQPPMLAAGLPLSEERPGGTWLPVPLNAAVSDLIGYCQEDFPRLCKVAIGEARRVEAAVCSGRLTVQAAQDKAQAIKAQASDAGHWAEWQVVLVAVAAGLLGAASGAGIYAIVMAR
jgi:hypothetical protein